jgi:homospermidine synthase
MDEVLSSWSGPIIFIGYGSIAQGLLPLLQRHVTYSPSQLFFIEPRTSELDKINLPETTLIAKALTKDNYKEILDSIVTASSEQALIINLSVDVSSVDIIAYAQSVNALYIDTVVEPWAGYYNDVTIPVAKRTNYYLREELLALRQTLPTETTAVSCCGANPGMVSWLTKEALLHIAKDTAVDIAEPTTRAEWATLMQTLGIKGVHIAEKDTQKSITKKTADEFLNTWSVDGLISESQQPAELGWGTHEQALPPSAHTHTLGSKAAIYLDTPGGATKVKSWVPSGPQEAYLVTHNEAISIAEYFSSIDDNGNVIYRPTCHYAYLPSPETITSLTELFSESITHTKHTVLAPENTETGFDELGVLLYGHAKKPIGMDRFYLLKKQNNSHQIRTRQVFKYHLPCLVVFSG